MSESIKDNGERELTIGEIIDDAITFLGIEAEALSPDEPDGHHCDMTPEEHELSRATIAYMGYRLLLTYRMKRSNAHRSAGGGVAMSHHSREIRQEIADALGISGPSADRENEVKRLYKIASKAEDEDEEYRKRVWNVMEGFIEDYDLDASNLGIVFI